MENQPFILAELEDLSSIFAPLKTTSRIKYTCFNVSNNFLIFGATSGGLYVFRREPCSFLQLLPNKEGSVTQVAISPDEKLIAFSTVRGTVCILEKSSHGAKHLITTTEHQNEQITCLQWNDGNNELFIGDNSGKVSIVTISVFPTKSMFQNPSFVLMQLDSKIVQMDFSSNMLLVSTLTKCYICDTTKEIFRQVGHKLRDGEYGACIFNTQTNHDVIFDSSKVENDKNSEYPALSHLKLLCARPGSRVWEVAIDGTVISTHHFKEALAIPPRKIHFLNSSSQTKDLNNSPLVNGSCMNSEQINSNLVEQSFNFQKLYILLSKYLFTYKSDGIYIFDPEKAAVVLWNNEIKNIVEVKCVHDVIYAWSGHGKLFALNLVPLEKFLVRLYFQKKYSDLVKLCLEYESFLLNQRNNLNRLHVLHDLDEKLKSDELLRKFSDPLKPLIDACKENAQRRKTQNAQKLKSGIYLIGNNDRVFLEDRRLHLRPSYLNLKGRSHSVSPERFQNGGLKHRGSSSSLPDLMKGGKAEENPGSTSEVVVNCKKEKEPNPSRPKIDTEAVSKAVEAIKKTADPPKESIFDLFDQILALSGCKTSSGDFNLELGLALPLDSHFREEDVQLISDLFNSSLRSKSACEWCGQLKGDWLGESLKKYPEFLSENHSIETLELDYTLSKVLKLFSSVLIENEIVETVKKMDLKCYYYCLSEILELYQDSSLCSVSVSNLDLANVTSTPKLLNVAYFLMNVGQIEQCSRYSHKIDLNDMFYLMLKFEESSSRSGKSSEMIELQCHTLFLSYLEKASEERKSLEGCSDMIETHVVNCLENIINAASCVRESNCGCGFPRPGLRPSMTMFPNVGRALVERNWPRDPVRCMKICGRVSYLWKYLIFLRRNEPLGDVLPLLVQAGELQELENRSREADGRIFEASVKCLIRLKSGRCLNCGEDVSGEGTVTWSELGMLWVKLLGPKETLRLYAKHAPEISSGELDQTFFRSLIFSSIVEKHGKGLGKNVVDLLAGKGTEHAGRVSVLSEKLRKEAFGGSRSAKLDLQTVKPESHHWGVRVDFKGNCALCCLPLDTRVLISEAGLLAFKCAHAFHSACLRKGSLDCPVCKSKPSEGKDLEEKGLR